MIPVHLKDICLILALLHDLLEDTDCPIEKLESAGDDFLKALDSLTKPEDMNYNEYIKKLSTDRYDEWQICAWWVKIADMKDHLTQVGTLTDELKKKYLAALPFLL